MNETQIVFEFPPNQFAFWREGDHLPAHATRTAYSLDDAGNIVRCWFVYPSNAWVDGIEPPLALAGELIRPTTIAPNSFSTRWDGKAGRLIQPPARWLALPHHRRITIHDRRWWQFWRKN
jgi:hypothetical protein